jgi:hypothetical protein
LTKTVDNHRTFVLLLFSLPLIKGELVRVVQTGCGSEGHPPPPENPLSNKRSRSKVDEPFERDKGE